MNIEKKNIVLTGASSGIGLELLNLLMDYEGVRIVAVARNIETIPSKNGVVFPFSADLKTSEGVDSVFDYALGTLGHIDIFIANAGYAYKEKLVTPDWSHIEDIYALNVFSPIYSLEKFALQKMSSKRCFVCVSSAVAMVSLPHYSLYCSTKAAIAQFMDTYVYEKDINLKTMTVYPVATRTDFFSKASKQDHPSLPFLVQNPDVVAKSILRGILKDKNKVYPSFLFRVFNRLGAVFPFLFKFFSKNELRKLNLF